MTDIEIKTSTVAAEPGWYAIWVWPAHNGEPATMTHMPIVAWVVEVAIKEGDVHEIETLPALVGTTLYTGGSDGMPHAVKNPHGKVSVPEWASANGLDPEDTVKLINQMMRG